jgi:hypothetical protein
VQLGPVWTIGLLALVCGIQVAADVAATRVGIAESGSGDTGTADAESAGRVAASDDGEA